MQIDRSWIFLLIAGALEMGFTTSMKLSEGFTRVPFVASFLAFAILSLFFLNKSLAGVPMGTAYAVWTGVGALGTSAIGIVFFHESAGLTRMLMLIALVASVAGLKIVS
jgi:quaternary ammonium compound-resistance protein SugE